MESHKDYFLGEKMTIPKFRIGDWVRYSYSNTDAAEYISDSMGIIQSEPQPLGNSFWYKVYFIGKESKVRASGLHHIYEQDLAPWSIGSNDNE